MPACMASVPADADTVRASWASTSTGNAPRLSTEARSSASDCVKSPVIETESVKFGSLTVGADWTTLSSTIARRCVGQVAAAAEALAGEVVPGVTSLAASQIDGDAPSLRRVERGFGAAPFEDLAGPLDRTEALGAPVAGRQDRRRSDRRIGSAPARRRRRAGSSRSDRVARNGVARNGVASVGGVGRRSPCGSERTGCPVGRCPVERCRSGRRSELPITGPVGAASTGWQLPGFSTGRSSTTPDTSTASAPPAGHEHRAGRPRWSRPAPGRRARRCPGVRARRGSGRG